MKINNRYLQMMLPVWLCIMGFTGCQQQVITEPESDVRFEVQPRPGNELVFTQVAQARPPFESYYERYTMTLRGDGTYTISKLGPEGDTRITGTIPGGTDEMRRLFQMLVNDGLYDLRSIQRRLGTTGPVTVPVASRNESPEQLAPGYAIHARINGRLLEVAYSVRNLPPQPPSPVRHIIEQLNTIRDRLDPPRH